MAHVKFDAFVEDVQRGQRTGEVFALRTSETHRRKGEDGRYFTTARTYRTVKMSRDASGSLEGFAKGQRVHVEGVEKTEKFNAADGREMYTLTVYADVVEQIQTGESSRQYNPPPMDDEPF